MASYLLQVHQKNMQKFLPKEHTFHTATRKKSAAPKYIGQQRLLHHLVQ